MRSVLAAAVLVLVAGSAAAGTRFDAASRDLRQAQPQVTTSVLWLEGSRLRLEADAAHTVIYHGDADVAWWIDHQDRTYRAIDGKATAAVAERAGQVNATARRYLEALPPDRRQAAERLLDRTLGPAAGVSPDIEVRPRGASERIAGVPCALFEVRRGGSLRAEVCRATFEAVGVAAESRHAVRTLVGSLGTALPVLAPERLRQDGIDALHAFTALDGVPLRVRLYEGDAAVWETRVTDVVEGEAPATAFDLPDGYARKLGLGAPSSSVPAQPAPH